MNIIYPKFCKILTKYSLNNTIINMTNCILKTNPDYNTFNHTLNPI